jgi:protein dithiol oxidoreductase (disulfide-forming)
MRKPITMNRRNLLKGTAAVAALSATPSLLLANEPFQVLETPVPQDASGKIEVLEFFHYGCPHCRNFYPLVLEWKKSLPADVKFSAVPAIWGRDQLRALARLYYVAERADVLDKVEPAVFVAIQDEKRPLFTEAEVRAWIGSTGVDAAVFMDTYNSFAIQGLVQRADQLARSYRVQGVPTMAVGGRFLTSATQTGSHANTLKVVNQLIERVRKGA